MCYSNSSTSSVIELEKKYGKKAHENKDIQPIFYVSGFSHPTWPIISEQAEIQTMHWGLIPNWFQGPSKSDFAKNTLNAKIETLHEKSSFKQLISQKRCLIPSTGFFEWKSVGKEKIPFFIKVKSAPIFSIAGLFDEWFDPKIGEKYTSFTMITCPANELMEEIHNTKKRMPLILNEERAKDWIIGKELDELMEYYKPVESEEMEAFEINKKIILSKNANCPEVQLPFKNEFYEQGSLF